MAARIKGLLSMACAVVILASCASAPSRFYTLAATATASGAPAASYAVIVGPVSVPASVDRAEFVVQVAPNRVDIDEFNRWASSPSEGIARTVAVDLATLLGTPRVAVAPLAHFDADYRVTIDVQRFDSIPGDSVLLDAVWVVRKIAGGESRSGRTVAREAVQGPDFEALPAAHSRAIARMSADIAAAIRAEAASPVNRQSSGRRGRGPTPSAPPSPTSR